MRLTVNLFLTLDGVYQSPGAPDEDPSGGFERGGWLVPYVDDDFNRIVGGWFENVEAILLGRRTYDIMSAWWPNVTDGSGDVLNNTPKHVASASAGEPEWRNTTLIRGDVAARIRELKAQPGGELQVHGSGALARWLHDEGLVDEFRLLVFPVVVGSGKRLFGEGAAACGFDLVRTEVTGAGVIHQVLRPTPFRSGGLAIEDGSEVLTD